MKIAVGSDERTHLTDFVIDELERRGIEIELHGALNDEDIEWTDVAEKVSERVRDGECEQGILLCWTGTGVSIAANKVPGVRAALCADAKTAEGARKWNDANVLAMSLRMTSPTIAAEIIESWLNAEPETFPHRLPGGWRERSKVVDQYGVISVVAISRIDLIAMKFIAGRAVDLEDLNTLRVTKQDAEFVRAYLLKLKEKHPDREGDNVDDRFELLDDWDFDE